MGDHPNGGGSENVGERVMSDEFDSLDATEKAAVEAALKKCCVLAAQIVNAIGMARRRELHHTELET
jgi:hypothetical protein